MLEPATLNPGSTSPSRAAQSRSTWHPSFLIFATLPLCCPAGWVADNYPRRIINTHTRDPDSKRMVDNHNCSAQGVRRTVDVCPLHRLQHHVLPWADHTLCGHGLQSRNIFRILPYHGAYITSHPIKSRD
jgi:hypothetical protein